MFFHEHEQEQVATKQHLCPYVPSCYYSCRACPFPDQINAELKQFSKCQSSLIAHWLSLAASCLCSKSCTSKYQVHYIPSNKFIAFQQLFPVAAGSCTASFGALEHVYLRIDSAGLVLVCCCATGYTHLPAIWSTYKSEQRSCTFSCSQKHVRYDWLLWVSA